MAKRTRLQAPKTKRKAADVIRYSNLGRPGWSLPQAADIVRQGYTIEHAQFLSGFDRKIIGNYTGK